MRTCRVIGPPATRRRVADGLVERLADDGPVAVVDWAGAAGDDPRLAGDGSGTASSHGIDPTALRAAGAATVHAVAADGTRVVTDEAPSLAGLLDELTPAHDYAIVLDGRGDGDSADDRPASGLATVAVGPDAAAVDPPGLVLGRADGAATLDLEAVVSGIETVEPRETLASLVAAVEARPEAERAGAIATFTGRVRAKDDPDDVRTTHLTFERYDAAARDRLARIRTALTDRDGVLAVRLHHRVGTVAAGDHIVHVVVLAGHRREAFRAVEDGIDRLKAEVPIFKEEVTVDGRFWSHDRPS